MALRQIHESVKSRYGHTIRIVRNGQTAIITDANLRRVRVDDVTGSATMDIPTYHISNKEISVSPLVEPRAKDKLFRGDKQYTINMAEEILDTDGTIVGWRLRIGG